MTAKLTLFDPLEVDGQAFLLAAHLPQGSLWQNSFSPDSNIGKLVIGLAVEFYRFQVLQQNLTTEMDIAQTNDLLIEWEKSVGLPDSCFSTNVSVETRRLQVEQKFSKFGGIQIADDFVRVAAVFGVTVNIFPGSQLGEFFPLEFPLPFESSRTIRHIIYVEVIGEVEVNDFPLLFPLPFGAGEFSFLQCIFDKLAPANVQVIIVPEGGLPS